jgi:hypothetical protein
MGEDVMLLIVVSGQHTHAPKSMNTHDACNIFFDQRVLINLDSKTPACARRFLSI